MGVKTCRAYIQNIITNKFWIYNPILVFFICFEKFIFNYRSLIISIVEGIFNSVKTVF